MRLFFFVVGPVGEVDELKEGAGGVGLNGDDVLIFFCAGFEELAALVGFVVGAGDLFSGRVFGGIGVSGMRAIEDLAVLGEGFFVIACDFIRGVVRLQFQNG